MKAELRAVPHDPLGLDSGRLLLVAQRSELRPRARRPRDLRGMTMASEHTDDPLAELLAVAKEKGLAVDFAVYGGVGLSEYIGGSRITGAADPMDSLRAGVRALKELSDG